MTKERYMVLKSSVEGAEAELDLFIIEILAAAEQNATREYNRDNFGDAAQRAKAMGHYWRAKAIQHAMLYVEDLKNSI